MQKYKLFLGLVVVISLLIVIVFGYTYLYKHWEEIYGPRAEEFCDFNVVGIDKEESLDNKTCYRVNFELTVKRDMYSVEIYPQERSGSITIISFDGGMPAMRTLKVRTVIYPTMLVQLENTNGWVKMRISFIDIDAHEKEISKTVEILPTPSPTPAPPPILVIKWFIILAAIVVSAVIVLVFFYWYRRRRG